MKDKVNDMRPEDINDDTADQAALILSHLQQNDVGRVSQTADAFYQWVGVLFIYLDPYNIYEIFTCM